MRRADLQVLVVSRRDVEADRQGGRVGLTFPVVLQRQWEISLQYAMFATPVGYLIDEQGILASDVAVGVGPILALADEPVRDSGDDAESLLPERGTHGRTENDSDHPTGQSVFPTCQSPSPSVFL